MQKAERYNIFLSKNPNLNKRLGELGMNFHSATIIGRHDLAEEVAEKAIRLHLDEVFFGLNELLSKK